MASEEELKAMGIEGDRSMWQRDTGLPSELT
jgi:hypothetical protein